MNYYPKQVEVLTSNGWKNFNCIKKDDKILILDLKTNVEYFKPYIKYYRKKFRGYLVNLIGMFIDIFMDKNGTILIDDHGNPKVIDVIKFNRKKHAISKNGKRFSIDRILKVKHKGYLYSLQVPKGIFYTRRNHKYSWCLS